MSTLKENYDKWHQNFYQTNLQEINKVTWEYYQWILDILKTKKGQMILDVACGKGLFLKVAKREGLKIYGIDLSETAIKEAKKVVAGEFIASNGENLPYPDQHFNYITCLGSLEHFENPDLGIKEMSRVIKSNGRICITVPNLFFIGHIYFAWRYGLQPSEGEQKFSENFKTRQGWQELLERNDLKIIKIYKYNEVSASSKVGTIGKIIFNYLIKPLLPLNLSYCFAFVCEKRLSLNDPQRKKIK